MNRSGFTLVELLVGVTIAGVLLAGSVVVLNSDGVAVNQAARALTASLNQVRFEAIESNRTAYLAFDATDAGAYTLWVDEDDDGQRDTGETLTTTTYGAGDLARLSLTASGLPDGNAIRFDRRGIPLDGLLGATFTVATSRSSRTLVLSSTGRPTIQ